MERPGPGPEPPSRRRRRILAACLLGAGVCLPLWALTAPSSGPGELPGLFSRIGWIDVGLTFDSPLEKRLADAALGPSIWSRTWSSTKRGLLWGLERRDDSLHLHVARVQTATTPSRPSPPRLSADRILIEKSARRLTLHRQGRQVKAYPVALGPNPIGPKRCQGDMKTPEGIYRIDYRNPHSAFHLSLHVSYPNTEDRAQSRRLRCSPGGDIMIHGLPNGQAEVGSRHRLNDWTHGCIAVTSEEIEEIWEAVPDGTVVEIRP